MNEASLEQKWEQVKRYYESCYRIPGTKDSIRFQKILDPKEILFLYDEMVRLAYTYRKYCC